MNEIITEKIYPVRKKWSAKAIVGYLLFLLFYFIVFSGAGSSASTNPDSIAGFNFLVILALGLGIISWLILILKIAAFHYSLEEQFLSVRQGFLSKQQRHIPYGVIQNIFIKQDLFDRLFGLASVAIENAANAGMGVGPSQKWGLKFGQSRRRVEMLGFSGNKINVPGLKKAEAEALKEAILQKIKENPIADGQSGL